MKASDIKTTTHSALRLALDAQDNGTASREQLELIERTAKADKEYVDNFVDR